MRKYINIIVASLILLTPSCSRDELEMLPTVPGDIDGQYKAWLHNLGALIDNKRPHPGEPFNIFFYFNGNEKDPVTKVTLLGKIVPNTVEADWYKDLEVLHIYGSSDWVYSRYYGADSLYMTIDVPASVPAVSTSSSTWSVYYRIAVETSRGFRDTTKGDYWGVLLPYNVATLSSIMVNGKTTGLTPAFNAGTFSYTYNVGPTVTQVPTVTVTKENASADVTITPATSLTGTEAERTTTIKVVSESGTVTNIYTVTFIKYE